MHACNNSRIEIRMYDEIHSHSLRVVFMHLVDIVDCSD